MNPTEVNNTSVRLVERASIRAFIEQCSDLLGGRVLDYGCGKQPYRDIVERVGGEYFAYDRVAFPANISGEDVGEEIQPGAYDTIICTQVAQYWPAPHRTLAYLHNLLGLRGHLVMTYPTTWAEVESADLWRYTRHGMNRLLEGAGFTVELHDVRAEIDLRGFRLPLGYGVVAKA